MTEHAPGTLITPTIRLKRAIGQGGMGTVWIADHLALNAPVVVKLMTANMLKSADSRTRFEREAAAAAQVKSPHVVQIFDFGVSEDGTPYMVMELLEGLDLGRYLTRKPRMPLADVAIVVMHVARALQRAHDRGIVHRDIKPENIFLCDVGTHEMFAKVLDFGIAKSDERGLSSLTRSGIVMGTPLYMSPELIMTAQKPDKRADLWALSTVAFEALTGQLPFIADSVALMALEFSRPARPVPSHSLPSLPRGLDAFFLKALAREPDDRFQSAAELGAAFVAASETRLSMPPRPSHLDLLGGDLPAAAKMPRGLPTLPLQRTTEETESHPRRRTESGAELIDDPDVLEPYESIAPPAASADAPTNPPSPLAPHRADRRLRLYVALAVVLAIVALLAILVR